MGTIATIEHVKELLASDAVADRFFESVAGGATPEEVCIEWGFTLRDFMTWIRLEPSRGIALAAANVAREEWLRQRLQREWADVAFSDVRDLFGDDGQLLPIKKWPRGIAKALSSYQVTEVIDAATEDGPTGAARVLKKYKLWDKLRASELLAKNLGMLNDRVTISGSVTLEHALADSWPGGRDAKPATTLDEAPLTIPQPRQILHDQIRPQETDPGFSQRPAPPKNQVGSEENEL